MLADQMLTIIPAVTGAKSAQHGQWATGATSGVHIMAKSQIVYMAPNAQTQSKLPTELGACTILEIF